MINNKLKNKVIYLENGLDINVTYLSQITNISELKILNIISKIENFFNNRSILSKELLILISEELNFKIIFNNNYLNILNQRIIGTLKIKRPPIITIMGHVNHGKTSLIDYIRNTNLVNNELGGITQKINAYNVNTKYGNITFIDTPGHEVFINMVNKGIKFTDIIILIIAANDGIQPQTIESIKISINLKLPIIVVINKIDLNKNISNIINDLNKYNIVSTEWGGKYEFINTSIKLGIGLDNLLKTIFKISNKLPLLVYNGMAKANVLDSYIDKNQGVIIKIIIMEGILKKGNIIVCGEQYGKVKRIFVNNKDLLEATPSMSVNLLALSKLDNLYDNLIVVNDEFIAKKIINFHKEVNKYNNININKNEYNIENIENNDILWNNLLDNKLLLNLIIKIDTLESKESIIYLLNKLKNTKNIKLNILYIKLGIITKKDIFLALNTNSYILSFNVELDQNTKYLLKNKKINIFYIKTIYELIDKLNYLINKLENINIQDNLIRGEAIIKNLFKGTKNNIIGCKVTNGNIYIKDIINIYRNDKLIFKGKIKSLKHFKNNVNVVKNGLECGIIIDIKDKLLFLKIGDIIKTNKI